MKSLASLGFLLAAFLLLPGCRKPTDDPSRAAEDSCSQDVVGACVNGDYAQAEDIPPGEPYNSPRIAFYRDFPSIERILGQPWCNLYEPKKSIMDFACVVQRGAAGEFAVEEAIVGHIPSDIDHCLGNGAVAGRYLVCSVMPWGGWQFGHEYGRPVFVARLSDDDTFTYGFNDELNTDLENLREICATNY